MLPRKLHRNCAQDRQADYHSQLQHLIGPCSGNYGTWMAHARPTTTPDCSMIDKLNTWMAHIWQTTTLGWSMPGKMLGQVQYLIDPWLAGYVRSRSLYWQSFMSVAIGSTCSVWNTSNPAPKAPLLPRLKSSSGHVKSVIHTIWTPYKTTWNTFIASLKIWPVLHVHSGDFIPESLHPNHFKFGVEHLFSSGTVTAWRRSTVYDKRLLNLKLGNRNDGQKYPDVSAHPGTMKP